MLILRCPYTSASAWGGEGDLHGILPPTIPPWYPPMGIPHVSDGDEHLKDILGVQGPFLKDRGVSSRCQLALSPLSRSSVYLD